MLYLELLSYIHLIFEAEGGWGSSNLWKGAGNKWESKGEKRLKRKGRSFCWEIENKNEREHSKVEQKWEESRELSEMQAPHSAHLLVGCLGPGLVALDNQKKLKGRRHRKPAKGTIGRSSRTSFRTVSLPWRLLSCGSPTQSQARVVPPSPTQEHPIGQVCQSPHWQFLWNRPLEMWKSPEQGTHPPSAVVAQAPCRITQN